MSALIGKTGVNVPLAALLACSCVAAQAAAQQRGRGVDPGVERLRAFDPAAVDRGKRVFAEKCSSCHRPNARGGEGFSGPDLIRSVLVLQDANGREIGEHLRAAHKPPITLAPADGSDVGTFLHREITYAAERTNYQMQYAMT